MSDAVKRFRVPIANVDVVLATAYDALEALCAERAEFINNIGPMMQRIADLEAENARLLAELDDASPFINCARCAKLDRMHRMCLEEGDEWECVECNDRCNAQEKDALAASNDKGDAT